MLDILSLKHYSSRKFDNIFLKYDNIRVVIKTSRLEDGFKDQSIMYQTFGSETFNSYKNYHQKRYRLKMLCLITQLCKSYVNHCKSLQSLHSVSYDLTTGHFMKENHLQRSGVLSKMHQVSNFMVLADESLTRKAIHLVVFFF